MNQTLSGWEIARERYHGIPALSASGMKDLAVSPTRFWFLHVNPNRPERKETPEMAFGTALHCAVLEPDEFDKRYACELNAGDIEGCLITMDDLRAWLKDKGLPSSAKSKREAIERVLAADPKAPILDVLQERHAAKNEGKVWLSAENWQRVQDAANALRSEPALAEILKHGQAEVPMFATDPETGVALKGRLDWITPDLILDLKTFSQKRSKSIDESICDAIFYEHYARQACLYSILRGWPERWDGDVVLAFVESDPPHEVRIKKLRPKSAGQPNLYWTRALLDIRQLVRLYAECLERFGDNPWRVPQKADLLVDEDIRQLAYSI